MMGHVYNSMPCPHICRFVKQPQLRVIMFTQRVLVLINLIKPLIDSASCSVSKQVH